MIKKTWPFILLLLTAACKEKYDLPVNSPVTGYLVVEGVINSGDGPTNIRLSRTSNLNANGIVYENGATVRVVGDNNTTFLLEEQSNGLYSAAQLFLDPASKYRLHINTSNGKEYISDFVEVKATPPIDSISWTRENGRVQLHISTHDAQNDTRYYLWDYVETWEYHSRYYSVLDYVIDTTPLGPHYEVGYRFLTGGFDSSMYYCWPSSASTELLLGSSAKLTEDRIYLPLTSIEQHSVKLNVLYSLYVRQYALTRDAYEFLEKMKKNSEEVGSIFDAQPSEIRGNIHCVDDPTELVVGYASVCSVEDKRLFISRDEVPDWRYVADCQEIVVQNQSDSVRMARAQGLIPTVPKVVTPFAIVSFNTGPRSCVDCTTFGTNIKPSYWP